MAMGILWSRYLHVLRKTPFKFYSDLPFPSLNVCDWRGVVSDGCGWQESAVFVVSYIVASESDRSNDIVTTRTK